MSEPALIQAHDLGVRYGSRPVFEQVSLEVRSGEFWFLVGRNGEGKTTLLRAMTGLVTPSSGTVTLSGRRRDILGFVPQRCDLNPTLPTTVREFMSLGLAGQRLPRSVQKDNLNWALVSVGMESRSQEDYWSLSLGQRQRVLLARALARRPKLLLLDEPTNGLDLATQENFLLLLQRLSHEESLTILFVAHDLLLAARFATHVALFAKQRVDAGPVSETLSAERLQDTYGFHFTVSGLGTPNAVVRAGEQATL